MRAFHPSDLFELTWLSDCDLSADGTRIAVTVTRLDKDADAYRSAIWVVDVASGAARQFTAGASRDFAPRWSPDGSRLAFLSERPGEAPRPQLAVIPADGGEARVLTTLGYGAGVPVWAPDGRRIVFSAKTGTPPDPASKKARPYRRIIELKSRINGEGWFYDCRRHLFVIDVDIAGAAPLQITDGPWDDVTPAWSPADDTIAFVSARHDSRDRDSWADVWLVPATGGTPTCVTDTAGDYESPSWSPDGTTLALIGRRMVAGTNGTIHLVPRAGGAPVPIDPTFDRQSGAGGLGSTAAPKWLDNARVLSAAEDRGDTALFVVGRDTPTSWVSRQPRHISAHAISARASRVAFIAATATTPAELFVLDLSTGTERQLTSFNAAWRGTVTLSTPEHITVPVAPDTEIDVWFMKPYGFTEGQRYPVLLNIHGGPFTQYARTFFDEFQVYTGAGYGVVYCNPRGSSGQSTAFGRHPIGHMGEDDFSDIMKALDAALARMPWADHSRLGVMGGSYGGFMTSWVIGHDHRFRAAISERAVNDWYTMQGTSDIGSFFNEAYLGDNAVIEGDLQAVLRQSPLTYAPQMQTPVLILHSEDDLRCPISQAEQLFVVLKRLGKDVEFVRFPDENHELSRSGKPSHRIDRFDVILDYLARKLGVPAVPPTHTPGA